VASPQAKSDEANMTSAGRFEEANLKILSNLKVNLRIMSSTPAPGSRPAVTESDLSKAEAVLLLGAFAALAASLFSFTTL
jgi:hypothetical protein